MKSLPTFALVCLVTGNLLLAAPSRAEDPSSEIRTVVENFNNVIFTDPAKSFSQMGYPFLMSDRVYLFEFELQRDLGKPVSLADFVKPEPKLVKVEVFKAGATPTADADYLKGLTAFIGRLGWKDAWLAKTTIRSKENAASSKEYEDRHYYLFRRSGTQWKIFGWAMASEMHGEGG